MIVRAMLKIQTGDKVRTNSLDMVGSDQSDITTAINSYCDAFRGVLKNTQNITGARCYEMMYNELTGKWDMESPLWDMTMSYTGKTGQSPGEPFPLGMKLLINQRDDSPWRDGRLMVSVPYNEGELEANGQRFTLTMGNSIQDNTVMAMSDVNALFDDTSTAFPVNLHRNVAAVYPVTLHYVRYVEKYRKRV